MQKSLEVFVICKAMAEQGTPNSITDAGVGVLCALAAVMGAYLNVKINSAGFKDKAFIDDILQKAENITDKAQKLEKEIIDFVNDKIK